MFRVSAAENLKKLADLLEAKPCPAESLALGYAERNIQHYYYTKAYYYKNTMDLITNLTADQLPLRQDLFARLLVELDKEKERFFWDQIKANGNRSPYNDKESYYYRDGLSGTLLYHHYKYVVAHRFQFLTGDERQTVLYAARGANYDHFYLIHEFEQVNDTIDHPSQNRQHHKPFYNKDLQDIYQTIDQPDLIPVPEYYASIITDLFSLIAQQQVLLDSLRKDDVAVDELAQKFNAQYQRWLLAGIYQTHSQNPFFLALKKAAEVDLPGAKKFHADFCSPEAQAKALFAEILQPKKAKYALVHLQRLSATCKSAHYYLGRYYEKLYDELGFFAGLVSSVKIAKTMYMHYDQAFRADMELKSIPVDTINRLIRCHESGIGACRNKDFAAQLRVRYSAIVSATRTDGLIENSLFDAGRSTVANKPHEAMNPVRRYGSYENNGNL